MVQINLSIATTILLAIGPSLGFCQEGQPLYARQQATSKGGRKIGIVIDESNSMQDNDPDNLRIEAAKALDDSLISGSEVKNDQTSDSVTVVGFHDSPDLLYPLGDPAGAIAAISNITSNKSGTFIGGGIGAAINETTKSGTGQTTNRTGIVVLTDGQDNSFGLSGVKGTINEILRARELGIRVSFGFLAVSPASQDSEILSACLKTGGTFSEFATPEAQRNFVDQVLLQGLTGMDATSNSGTTLLPGLTTSAILQEEGNTFSYFGQANEQFSINVTSLDFGLPLMAILRDMKNDKEAGTNSTDATGLAQIQYTASTNTTFQLTVRPNGTTEAAQIAGGEESIFSVGVQSSLGLTAGRAPENNSGVKAYGKEAALFNLGAIFIGALILWG